MLCRKFRVPQDFSDGPDDLIQELPFPRGSIFQKFLNLGEGCCRIRRLGAGKQTVDRNAERVSDLNQSAETCLFAPALNMTQVGCGKVRGFSKGFLGAAALLAECTDVDSDCLKVDGNPSFYAMCFRRRQTRAGAGSAAGQEEPGPAGMRLCWRT